MAPDDSKQFREKKKMKKESVERKKGKRMYLKEGECVEKSGVVLKLMCSGFFSSTGQWFTTKLMLIQYRTFYTVL